MAEDAKEFLEIVLKRSEEICLSANRNTSSDFLSELLKHIDLLGKTVQLLQEIKDIVVEAGELDSEKWQHLVNVYGEIESELICLYHQEVTQITITCELPWSFKFTKVFHHFRQGN